MTGIRLHCQRVEQVCGEFREQSRCGSGGFYQFIGEYLCETYLQSVCECLVGTGIRLSEPPFVIYASFLGSYNVSLGLLHVAQFRVDYLHFDPGCVHTLRCLRVPLRDTVCCQPFQVFFQHFDPVSLIIDVWVAELANVPHPVQDLFEHFDLALAGPSPAVILKFVLVQTDAALQRDIVPEVQLDSAVVDHGAAGREALAVVVCGIETEAVGVQGLREGKGLTHQQGQGQTVARVAGFAEGGSRREGGGREQEGEGLGHGERKQDQGERGGCTICLIIWISLIALSIVPSTITTATPVSSSILTSSITVLQNPSPRPVLTTIIICHILTTAICIGHISTSSISTGPISTSSISTVHISTAISISIGPVFTTISIGPVLITISIVSSSVWGSIVGIRVGIWRLLGLGTVFLGQRQVLVEHYISC